MQDTGGSSGILPAIIGLQIMSARRGNLQPAHRGYLYQDISAAYILVRAVVERYEEVIVDRKQVADDRIDDLEVAAAGRRVRRQFKSSHDAQRRLTTNDFIAVDSSIRIDRLVLTYVRAGPRPADEYRVCATWQPPDSEDALSELLEPVWGPLVPFRQSGAEFGRDDFIAFCMRFVIELSLPTASTNLTEPGPLEHAIVDELAEHIGIGRYPNHGRLPSDVAALGVSLATLARSQGRALSPADVERELAIRTDFGRVAQAFPLDEALFHDRPVFRQSLRDAALAGRHQVLTGPPGAGKSWELTRLANELDEAGAIVARHYCYLEPGDELVTRRVTADVFFGNILAELVDAAPDLLGASEARYAAGLSELEATLDRAATLGRPIILIVDGLDHIARVRADTRSLREDETDIIERLAMLVVPAGVALVIGSQPGEHLDSLRAQWGASLTERRLPRWRPPDVSALAQRYGVVRALEAVGITDHDDLDLVLGSLANRVDGNPLYARYLVRGLVTGLHDGSVTNPHDWLLAAPVIAGDIAVYYAHLYRPVQREAQAIADLLAAIDFAVTEGELREMLPPLVSAFVPQILARLAPVLTTSAGQGGVRIFHESFRRFMTEELVRHGRSPANALAPVIDWLVHRGFYRDAKSYRFLLPALRRAGQDADVLATVNVKFVSESVAQAQPLDAIQRNLAVAADVAARARDWPALVRLVELHRSAYNSFDALQDSWGDYSVTYLELFGPAALAERLLFDGRPTQALGEGILGCALVDGAGGVAPWGEYLELLKEGELESADRFDEGGALTKSERVIVGTVHGLLRMGSRIPVIKWLYQHLREHRDGFRPPFIRALAKTIAQLVSPSFVELIAVRADPARRGGPLISRRAAAVLRLGAADEYVCRGNHSEATAVATRALQGADTPELAVACLVHGVSAEIVARIAPDPSTLPIAVSPGEYLHNAAGVRSWVASVRLIANDSANGRRILDVERQRVNGVGWYRCWLRFVLALALTEGVRRIGGATDVIGAFEELTYDVHPFRGTPRACDLYAIRQVISETIAWGISLLRTDNEWYRALDFVSSAAQGTRSC
jgi:hypothetical protein